MSSELRILHQQIQTRATQITTDHHDWPCRKGCSDCCRNLASVPLLTRAEWQLADNAIQSLPAQTANQIYERIKDASRASRPVVCPMLDTEAGTCLIYDARPIACRAYGFYLEREKVLGCNRIESIAQQEECGVIWGNHLALEDTLHSLAGPSVELHQWLRC